jgi:hypothetical protein
MARILTYNEKFFNSDIDHIQDLFSTRKTIMAGILTTVKEANL